MTHLAPSFEALHQLMATYRTAYAQRLVGAETDLAREATQHIQDLVRLRQRIESHLTAIHTENDAQAQAILLEVAKVDPVVAEWLAKNHGSKGQSLAKGYTLGQGTEPGDTFESPLEQDLRLDTEAYYHHAHRLIKCMQQLPGLERAECTPIMIVRNQLLEHPEGKASTVTLPSFAYNRENGPQIKGTRYGSQTEIHPDAGLIPNDRSLTVALTGTITAAIAKVPPIAT